MKAYYSDYVQHCMRFYARHPHPKFHNEVEKQNWHVCDKVLKMFEPDEQEILIIIYHRSDTLADNIYTLSTERGLNQDTVWKLVAKLEKAVAKRRGLL